jgi:hypothetical protein
MENEKPGPRYLAAWRVGCQYAGYSFPIDHPVISIPLLGKNLSRDIATLMNALLCDRKVA